MRTPSYASKSLTNQIGSTLSPMMAAIFVALVLMILAFSLIAHLLRESLYLTWAYAGASVVIGLVLLGVYRLLRYRQKRRMATGRRDPLLLRQMMEGELEATVNPVKKCLDNPGLAVEEVFGLLLQDQIEGLFTTDTLRFTELRRQFEKSGLEKRSGCGFRRFFQSEEAYAATPLPEALLLMERAVAKSHDERLAERLNLLKDAHRGLHTSMGDYLDLLPSTPEEVKKLQKRYPFRPPEEDLARQLIFAGRVLNHLIRRASSEPEPKAALLDGARLDEAADVRVPRLSAALSSYENAWRELLDAYDRRQ
jgi:hypothetical protein